MARKAGRAKGEIEVYKHDDTRENAVPPGLASYDTSKPKQKKYAYDLHLDPQIVWADKAEHTSFEVPTVSIHIHDRILSKALNRGKSNEKTQNRFSFVERQAFHMMAANNSEIEKKLWQAAYQINGMFKASNWNLSGYHKLGYPLTGEGMEIIVQQEVIEGKIYMIRGHKVMLDSDLAELYAVPTKRLNEQVRRNITRFPSDFMFQLSEDETASLRSQIATLKKGRGEHRKSDLRGGSAWRDTGQ